MLSYTSKPEHIYAINGTSVNSFIKEEEGNFDEETVKSFGEEWSRFKNFSEVEIQKAGDQYFDIITPEMLNKESLVLDVGCGMGRWSYFIADRVKLIEAIDPSKAVFSAVEYTKPKQNIRITQAGVNNIPFADTTFDFVFSLGVLHHVPDTEEAIIKSVKKVKQGGYFLIYLYYSLDNRGILFKLLFKASDLLRNMIYRMPSSLKRFTCDVLAFCVYLPFVFVSRFLKKLLPKNPLYKKIPLSYYHDKSIQIIRNDSLDRFGTPLEQRFSRKEIEQMLKKAGLTDIVFSEYEPYWHAVGKKA